MIYQYAFTVTALCGIGFLVGGAGSSPFPNIYNWGDRLAGLSAIVGILSAVVGIIAKIWGI